MSGKYSDRDREELIHLLECYTTESEALEFAIENADYLLKDHQSDRAVEADLEYLRRVGVDWSPHPTKDEVRQEYERIGRQLGSRLIEALVDRPSRLQKLLHHAHLGEPGTGKVPTARIIHDPSPRENRALLKLNCGAIFAGLVESELFGQANWALAAPIDVHVVSPLLSANPFSPPSDARTSQGIYPSLSAKSFLRSARTHQKTVAKRKIISTVREFPSRGSRWQQISMYAASLTYLRDLYPIAGGS